MMRMEVGQVRRDLRTGGQLVELVMGHTGIGTDYTVRSWTVSDLRTGEEYERKVAFIGSQVFNEMEALAWAAS